MFLQKENRGAPVGTPLSLADLAKRSGFGGRFPRRCEPPHRFAAVSCGLVERGGHRRFVVLVRGDHVGGRVEDRFIILLLSFGILLVLAADVGCPSDYPHDDKDNRNHPSRDGIFFNKIPHVSTSLSLFGRVKLNFDFLEERFDLSYI